MGSSKTVDRGCQVGGCAKRRSTGGVAFTPSQWSGVHCERTRSSALEGRRRGAKTAGLSSRYRSHEGDGFRARGSARAEKHQQHTTDKMDGRVDCTPSAPISQIEIKQKPGYIYEQGSKVGHGNGSPRSSFTFLSTLVFVCLKLNSVLGPVTVVVVVVVVVVAECAGARCSDLWLAHSQEVSSWTRGVAFPRPLANQPRVAATSFPFSDTENMDGPPPS